MSDTDQDTPTEGKAPDTGEATGGFEKLLNHVLALSPEELGLVRLEDITLCASWYDSFRDYPDVQRQFDPIRQQLDLWVQHASQDPTKTEGHRQQPILRTLIREAVQGRIEEMHRDEVDFLYFTFGLAQRTGKTELFERPTACLRPLIGDIERRRDEVDMAPGLPNLAARISFFVTQDLERASPRNIKLFAGIDVSMRGPVLVHRGDAKLLGNVPPECALVVEGGSCFVSGMVLGKLAATNSCEIFDNVSGIVIARRGNIAARNILNQAVVIAKEGSLHCYGAEGPKLVFAGKDLHVTTSLLGGKYFCRQLKVGEEVQGGVIQVTGKAESGQFTHTAKRPLYIVLRRGLTCQDYGEVLTTEASKMLTNAIRLRQRVSNLDDLLEITEREADQQAGNILVYLLGEEKDLGEGLQSVQQKRRRLAFFERLQAGVRAITLSVEDRLASMSQAEEATVDDFDLPLGPISEESSPTDQLRRELMLLAAEGAVDRDLQEMREEVLNLGRRLQRRGMSREGMLQVFERLLQRGEAINTQAETLKAEVQELEGVLEFSIERASIIERAKAECARVEVVDQLLLAARQRKGTKQLLRRAAERSVKLLRRNIENRISRAGEYRKTMQDFEVSIRKIRERLWEVHQVSLPDNILEGWLNEGAQVTGRFSAGVWICAWQHLIEHGQPSDQSLVVTPHSGEAVLTFVRTGHGTIERQQS